MKYICLFYFVFHIYRDVLLIYISYLIIFALRLETIWKILDDDIMECIENANVFSKKKTLTNNVRKCSLTLIYVFNISSNFVYKYVIIVWLYFYYVQ